VLPPLLRKELAWGRRKVAVLAVVFLLLPGAFAYGTVAFQTVLPTDAPVAVVPASGETTADDLTIAEGALAPFSEPRRYDSRAGAFDALDRERVYAVVSVPANVTGAGGTAVFDVAVSGSVVPYHQASSAVVSVLNGVLEERLPADIDVRVERSVVGTERSLSAYLVPAFLLALPMTVALTYLPHSLHGERRAIDRLRVESSLARVVAWKLAFFAALSCLPLAVFGAASARLGYGVSVLSLGVLAVYLLTFLTLGAVSLSVTLLARFSTAGRLANVVFLLFLFLFSGLFYPTGFFSPLRRELVRSVPTYYAGVMLRGFTLRDASPGFFAAWLVGLAGVAALALLGLRASVWAYERGAA
jgi:ABC-2 type transport system permease protein